jgi:hypothetical protein
MTRAVPPQQLITDRANTAAIEIAASWVARLGRGRTMRLRTLADPAALRAIVTMARTMPVVEASFSDSSAGHELRAWFGPGRALPLDRAPVALLPLPATEAEYLRGRAKQALRTNVTRALEAGIRVSAPGSAAELFDCIVELAARRRQPVGEMVPRRSRDGLVRHFAVAWDDAGEPVALTETIIDGPWAGLAVLVSNGAHAQASPARYLLHLHTVRQLIGEDVRQLVVGGSMLLSAPGVRYFQQRTGFVPVRLKTTRLAGVRERDLRLREPAVLTLEDLIPAVMPGPDLGERHGRSRRPSARTSSAWGMSHRGDATSVAASGGSQLLG